MDPQWNRELADNVVRYRLYPNLNVTDIKDVKIKLNQYISSAFTNLAIYLAQYIWQYEPFQLRPVISSNSNDFFIQGTTNFGDNIEDEWFIVFLLLELTKLDKSLVVKVEDNDGEFLLIEAAEYLPKWCQPETSENRTFLYQGSLHLIPLKEGPLPEGTPNIRDAIDVVRRFTKRLRCKEKIQQTIAQRISQYPSNILKSRHSAHCFVPLNVANILVQDPSLVAYAVRAFHMRDPIDLKACKKMKYFPPETRIMRNVTMTRCLYAQLMSQNFKPDEKVGWKMPSQKSQSFKSHDLGMKLACGFEILVANYESKSMKNEGASESKEIEGEIKVKEKDLKSDPRWEKFHKSLTNNGFFERNIEGSRRYNELLIRAKNYYLQSIANDLDCDIEDEGEESLMFDVANRVLGFLKSVDLESNGLKETKLEKEDSDDWMHCNPDELDAFLGQAFAKSKDEPSKDNKKDLSELAKLIPSSLKTFMEENSDLKGVEVPSGNKKESTKTQVNFNPESFADALKSVLSFKIPHSDSDASSSSGMSDFDYSDNDDASDESYSNEIDDFKMNGINNDSKANKINNNKEQEQDSSSKSEADGGNDMKTYMDIMDKQLAQTKVGQSFERKAAPLAHVDEDDSDDDDDEEYAPVDVDLTALKNILESYESEQGVPGPASTLFTSMGINLPNNKDE